MVNKPKAIGTSAESAVVKFLKPNGYPKAERRVLMGEFDQGDINTGDSRICIEVKGGEAARKASDNQILAWLAETETERRNAGADIGVLVIQRRGVGPANAGRWWAVMRIGTVAILRLHLINPAPETWAGPPVRMLLADAVTLLRAAGYGDPLEEAAA